MAALAEAITTTPDGYTLRWADEFNAEALNEAIWNIEVNGNGGGNQELQYYKRENVTMEADPKTGERCLVLTARRESFGGKNFTSGRVYIAEQGSFPSRHDSGPHQVPLHQRRPLARLLDDGQRYEQIWLAPLRRVGYRGTRACQRY